MKNYSKIVVVLLITILSLTACTTTSAGENQLLINKKIVSFDLDGGEFVEGEFLRADTESKDKTIDSVKLPMAEKNGYTFMGWEEIKDGGEAEDHVEYVLKGDVISPLLFEADWNIITYTINYLEPGEVPDDYPSEEDFVVEVEEEVEEEVVLSEPQLERKYSYTVEDEVLFPLPERKGFTFLGWAEVPSNIDEITLTSEILEEAADPSYSIEVGTTGDKVLVPLWERNTYRVEYLLNDGSLEERNTSEYLYGGEGFSLNEPVREHYIFSGWQDTHEGGKIYFDRFDDTTLDRDVELSALWTPEVYRIVYDLDGGHFDGEYPTEYTYESETFTLPVPEREGYKFVGWKTMETVEFTPVLFALSFTIDGVDISVNVFETKVEILLPLAMKSEFVSAAQSYLQNEFPGSEVSVNGSLITLSVCGGESSPVEDELKKIASEFGIVLNYNKVVEDEVVYNEVTIYRGSYGERSYKADWEIIEYSITYAQEGEYGPKIEEEVVYENPTYYTSRDTVEIKNAEKFGYDFMGWILEGEEYTEAKMDLVIEEGSVGNRVYVPLFKLHEYSVVLDLGGGKVETESSFTIKDKNFTIGEARREGCVFAGWLDNDGSVKRTVTVHCAEGKDVVLKALWIPNKYTIEYDLNGGRLPIGEGNPESFDVDTVSFTLINPVKDTYDFAGWIRKDREGKDWPEVDYLFDTSVIGDVELVATWKESVYTIDYSLDGGHFEYSDSNPSSFTNYSADITLEKPYRDGYTFLGWVEKGKEGNRPLLDYTIDVSEVREDVYLKAVWEATSYPICYHLDGGYYQRGAALNPDSYTITDRAFILTNPIRDGYEFLGWVRSGYSGTDKPTKLMRVETKDGGKLGYTALWSAKTYTITYVLDGGTYMYGNSNPESYSIESLITLASPHKDGYTFTGWIMSGDPSEEKKDSVTIYPGTTGDLTFYATYEKALVALGEATKLQKEIVEVGKNGILRPDWVIEAPKSNIYYYEKAYASGLDFITNLENAEKKCREYIASYLGTSVESLEKDVNGTAFSSLTISVDTLVKGSELVEYWEDAEGGVWVLMKIEK